MRCVSGNKLVLATICVLILTLTCSANTLGGNSDGRCIAGNCYNGHGTWLYDTGGRYVGQWSNGKRNGQGIDYFANGDIYDGQFVNSARSGYGKLTFASGEIYTGQWANNKRNGQGRDEYPDGSIDEGHFLDDYLVRGKVKYNDGYIYTGEVLGIEGKRYRHGLGTYKMPDGSIYTGSFKKNEPDGKGVYTDANGVQWDQIWENGDKISSKERVADNYTKGNNHTQAANKTHNTSKAPVKINPEQSNPDIHFDEFTITPDHVPAGGKFELTVQYTASDTRTPNDPVPIVYYYKIVKEGKLLYESEHIAIQSPNGQPTFATEKRIIKVGKIKGIYSIRVRLMYEKTKGIMSKKDFFIE